MHLSLQESFDRHSVNYGKRVMDRTTYGNLSVEDEIIARYLKHSWSPPTDASLLDAGCGSGDRLRMLFEQQGLQRQTFSTVIGIDYSEGMLSEAGKQTLDDLALYNQLIAADLLAPQTPLPVGDVVLCLWEITNSCGPRANQLLSSLGKMLRDGGVLFVDALTTKASGVLKEKEVAILGNHPELSPHDDPQTVWYQRDDASIGYLRMLSPGELNEILAASGAELVEVWGYNHRELVPNQVSVQDGRMDEAAAANFTGLLFIQHKK